MSKKQEEKMKEKITADFVINSYSQAIQSYSKATLEIGLWESEQTVFETYLKKENKILDIGCGTGRTTFGLYKLGYQNIEAIDITPAMIQEAQEIGKAKKLTIDFKVGDATELTYEDATFDHAIFSFNGMMSIPKRENRQKAVQEIYRVLKKGGYFIFTTHDREYDENYTVFWEEQRLIWEKGQQSSALFEFGNIIASSKNEPRPIFIHIPSRAEILNLIEKAGFTLSTDFYRSDRFDEQDAIKAVSGECRFWVVQKV